VGPDFHKPCPGQTETLCDLYINLLRGVIDHQQQLIADLQRRAAGQPITRTWINGVLQDEPE
jgi:hypothetical protein